MQAGGSDLFWYTLTNSLEHFLQLNKRLHRRGATGQIRIHIPVAKNTVDEVVVKSLMSKDREQKSLLDALREYRESKRGGDRLKI
jgi:SNF2 family DNA or RNA helicase